MLILAGSTLAYCYATPTYTWHQKITVEVESDGRLFTGPSVVEMTVEGIPEELQFRTARKLGRMRGEAVVVALPGERSLFGLLTYDAFLTGKVFHDLVGWIVSQPEKGWAQAIQKVRETRELNPKDYPLLVTFTDINDPKTVQQVDSDNLAATFWPGVSLKRITLEITDEPVTEGKIESVLGWWNNLTVPIGGKVDRKYGDPLYGLGKWSFVRR
ncbi:MAG: hypothetical protein R3B95_09435 [Nitrospirales bacterium]|nr:hypothetical protein [Nitrospirales bacterium]